MNLKQELQNMVKEFKLEEQRKLEVEKGRAILSLPSITEALLLKVKEEASLGKLWYSTTYYNSTDSDKFILADDIVNHFKQLGLKSSYYLSCGRDDNGYKDRNNRSKVVTIDWGPDIKVNWFWKLLGHK